MNPMKYLLIALGWFFILIHQDQAIRIGDFSGWRACQSTGEAMLTAYPDDTILLFQCISSSGDRVQIHPPTN